MNFTGASIEFFQLKNIRFPDTFAAAMTQKQTVQQNEITQMNDRTTQLILANTTMFQAERTASINLINAQNQANIIMNNALTQSNIIQNQWRQRAQAYGTILNYLRAEILRGAGAPVVNI